MVVCVFMTILKHLGQFRCPKENHKAVKNLNNQLVRPYNLRCLVVVGLKFFSSSLYILVYPEVLKVSLL
jgi:hypothetical protein